MTLSKRQKELVSMVEGGTEVKETLYGWTGGDEFFQTRTVKPLLDGGVLAAVSGRYGYKKRLALPVQKAEDPAVRSVVQGEGEA